MRERIGAIRNIENFSSSIEVTIPRGIPAIRVTKAAIKPNCIANFLRFNKAITNPAHTMEPIQLSRCPIINTVSPPDPFWSCPPTGIQACLPSFLFQIVPVESHLI